jgi:hypothetical protein
MNSIDADKIIAHIAQQVVGTAFTDRAQKELAGRIVAALEPVRELIEKATALTEKLKAIHANPRYQSVWMVSQIHVGQYEGPKYDEEQDAMDAALARLAALGEE